MTLDGEVCDWHRFSNRKQIGSYTGCCPGEHSSGNKRRVGGIDRMGNGRVRALLVEAVWRFLQWQPNWKAAVKMKTKLGAGTAMKKKTVIALARQLAIDLWRWRTGRCTHGRTRLGAGITLTLDLILSDSREQSVSEFATGWFLPVAGAGRRKPCPSVRRGGTPGRRSHTSMTPWALGLVPTVRIGAGAWHLARHAFKRRHRSIILTRRTQE